MGWNLNLVRFRHYWNQSWDPEEEIICECVFLCVPFSQCVDVYILCGSRV